MRKQRSSLLCPHSQHTCTAHVPCETESSLVRHKCSLGYTLIVLLQYIGFTPVCFTTLFPSFFFIFSYFLLFRYPCALSLIFSSTIRSFYCVSYMLNSLLCTEAFKFICISISDWFLEKNAYLFSPYLTVVVYSVSLRWCSQLCSL